MLLTVNCVSLFSPLRTGCWRVRVPLAAALGRVACGCRSGIPASRRIRRPLRMRVEALLETSDVIHLCARRDSLNGSSLRLVEAVVPLPALHLFAAGVCRMRARRVRSIAFVRSNRMAACCRSQQGCCRDRNVSESWRIRSVRHFLLTFPTFCFALFALRGGVSCVHPSS